jgi:hypothetical protein
MTITINRAYDSWAQAQNAVRGLESEGIPSREISLVANRHVDDKYTTSGPSSGTSPRLVTKEDDSAATEVGAGAGAAVGGGVGLLAGLGMLAIPGLGPVVAAGWLAALATGAAAGATTGGIVGALVEAGEDKDTAHVYGESLRRGGSLVTVRTDEANRAKVERVLASYQPIDYQARGNEYRQAGWKQFDDKAAAYKPSESELERIRRKWPDAAE